MNQFGMLLLEALLFALCFGALAWLRGEGLPKRLALEVLVVTVVLLGGSAALGAPLHPVLFLALLYLITMRSRLLVDLANWLSGRGKHDAALGVLVQAERLAGDATTRLLVAINRGVVRIRQNRCDEAIEELNSALAGLPDAPCGKRNEVACRYNLAVANLKAGQESAATEQFSAVIGLLPNSLYARAARAALARGTKVPSRKGDGSREG